jgi:hypothetical protein
MRKLLRRIWSDEYYNPNRYALNIAYFQRDILDEISSTLPKPHNGSIRYTYNDLMWLAIQALVERIGFEITAEYEANGHVDLAKALEG